MHVGLNIFIWVKVYGFLILLFSGILPWRILWKWMINIFTFEKMELWLKIEIIFSWNAIMVSKIANGDGYKILDIFSTYHMILNYTVDTLEIIPVQTLIPGSWICSCILVLFMGQWVFTNIISGWAKRHFKNERSNHDDGWN